MAKTVPPEAPIYEAGGFQDGPRATIVRVFVHADAEAPIALEISVGQRTLSARLSRTQAELIDSALGRAQRWEPAKDSRLPQPEVEPNAYISSTLIRAQGRAFRVPEPVAALAREALDARAAAAAKAKAAAPTKPGK